MTKGSNNEFPSLLLTEQGAAPATPATGNWRLYVKADGLYLVDDNGSEIGPFATATSGYTEGARVYNNADVSLTQSADTLITFNSESYDTDAIHSVSVNTGRLTCKTPGKYLIVGNVKFTAQSAGAQDLLYIKHNNTKYIAGSQIPTSINGQTGRVVVTTIYDLATNDYVELWAYCMEASPKAVYVDDYSPVFMMQRIG
jgi:hypothetical protein